MDTKHESANLILKLYELRREETMRKGRDWFARFGPESGQDIMNAVMGESSAYYRMVTTYWEMVASLVNNGAIDEKMFNDANGEHIFVFAKVEPFLAEIRQMFNAPQALAQLEQLVMRLPDAKERLVAMRERSKRIAAMRAEAASKKEQV
ncbi:MAG: DUF4760 domain-containing protein [Pyrinomonadaceae bacterium]|nr:DUF4760 domain-containing protein [Pyrinomonadaceae bacterium]